jgi:hypothetical protein
MAAESQNFRAEIDEASRALSDIAELKRRLTEDLTDLTYEQVRLLEQSIGRIRQLQGRYRSYSFAGSSVVYGAVRLDGAAAHQLPPDRYRVLEVLAEPAHGVLVVLMPELNESEITYTAYADSLQVVSDDQIADPMALSHPRRPDGESPSDAS